MKKFIVAWGKKFDSEKYPIDFYYNCLEKINSAKSAKELGKYIIALVHWKDGKVVEGNNGDFTIGGKRYLLNNTKPNTYSSSKHKVIIESKSFFDWAKGIINENKLNADNIKCLTGEMFELWSDTALVIPAFILHILNPKIYPLYDQHVERAKKVLLSETNLFSDKNSLSIESYVNYSVFLNSILEEFYRSKKELSLEEIKKVDDALWSFGKWLNGFSFFFF